MSKSAVITARLDESVMTLVDQIAKANGRSRSWFVAQAVQRVAESEAEFLAFVQEGEDAIARGEFHSHAEIIAELDQMIALHKARAQAS